MRVNHRADCSRGIKQVTERKKAHSTDHRHETMRQVLNKAIVLVIDVSVNFFILITLSRGENVFHQCHELSSRDDANCECKMIPAAQSTWVS